MSVQGDTRLCGDDVWSVWSVILKEGETYSQVFGADLETVDDFFLYFGPVDWRAIKNQSIFAIMRKGIQPQWESEEVTHKVNLGWETVDGDRIMKLLWSAVTGAFNKTGCFCGIYCSAKVVSAKVRGFEKRIIKMELWFDDRGTEKIDRDALRSVLCEIGCPIEEVIVDAVPKIVKRT